MSTRSQILVEGATAIVYRHSDGYPDGPHGVLKSLCPLVAEFVKYRGHDEEYLPAHIVADQIARHKKWSASYIRKLKKEGKDESYLSSYRQAAFLGFGVESYDADSTGHTLHGDIEYLYVVKKEGFIEVRTPEWGGFGDEATASNIGNTKLLKCVGFDGKPVKKARKTRKKAAV